MIFDMTYEIKRIDVWDEKKGKKINKTLHKKVIKESEDELDKIRKNLAKKYKTNKNFVHLVYKEK